MWIRRHSNFYNFIGNKKSGLTFRWGETFSEDPKFAPWPELADISISNHCSKNCAHCYRNSKTDYSFMKIEDYKNILLSLQHPKWGSVFQVAIGGGEPLEHPNFFEIIELTNHYGIVPNFTTNGIHLNPLVIERLAGKIGALAISVTNIVNLDLKLLKALRNAEIKTNVHFLLSGATIKQAVNILKGKFNSFLKELNGIVFLTYKPLGRAKLSDCLIMDDSFKEFISLVDNNCSATRIGFDACFVPVLLHCTKTNVNFIDPCECGFFSVYIDECLNVKPCSFTDNCQHIYSLKDYNFCEIWENKFRKYRLEMMNSCQRACNNRAICRGGCPYFDMINFCFTPHYEEALAI